MNKRTLESTFTILALLLGGMGCGSDMDEDSTDTGQASLGLHVVKSQDANIKEVNLDVQSMGVMDQRGTKSEIATPRRAINLLTLDKNFGQLIGRGKLAPGKYSRMWMRLGKGHTIRFADGRLQPLVVKADAFQHVVFPIDLNARAGERRDLIVDFDTGRSIRRMGSPGAGEWVFVPNPSALDLGKTGSIAGQLSDLLGRPLKGAKVFAETADQSGLAQIIRNALTDEKGAYALPFLPLGKTYHIVSQPRIEGTPYVTKASQGILLDQNNLTGKYDAGFEQAPYFGGLAVKVTPQAIAQESDTCSLMQEGLAEGKKLVVGQESVAQAAQAKFEQVPSGPYAVQCHRAKLDWTGSRLAQASKLVQAAVKTSETQDIVVPF